MAWVEPFFLPGTLGHRFSVPSDMLSSLATASSVRVPRCLALLKACSLNSAEYGK